MTVGIFTYLFDCMIVIDRSTVHGRSYFIVFNTRAWLLVVVVAVAVAAAVEVACSTLQKKKLQKCLAVGKQMCP